MASIPFELWVHNLDLRGFTPEAPLVLVVQVERRKGGWQTVFVSRRVGREAGKGVVALNEKVCSSLEFSEAFFRFFFAYLDGEGGIARTFEPLLCFQPDLITKTHQLAVPITGGQRADLHYEIITSEKRSFNDEVAFAHVPANEDISGTLEKLATSQKFLRGITPLRRGVFALKKELAAKRPKRDLGVALFILLFVYFGNYLLVIGFLYLVASKEIYRFRFRVVEAGLWLFYNQNAPGEIKDNLELIRWQQLQVIALLEQIKAAVYHRNRTALQLFFTKGLLALCLGMILVYNFPKRVLFTALVVGAVLKRYLPELQEQALRMGKVAQLVNFARNKISNLDSIADIRDSVERSPQKTCFIIEEQFISAYSGRRNSISISCGYLTRPDETARLFSHPRGELH